MEGNFQTSEQEQVFRKLIDEFKKSRPNELQIEKFMNKLDLSYQPDHFANMQMVLNAINFGFKKETFEEA